MEQGHKKNCPEIIPNSSHLLFSCKINIFHRGRRHNHHHDCHRRNHRHGCHRRNRHHGYRRRNHHHGCRLQVILFWGELRLLRYSCLQILFR